jgi:hypothetical protein
MADPKSVRDEIPVRDRFEENKMVPAGGIEPTA